MKVPEDEVGVNAVMALDGACAKISKVALKEKGRSTYIEHAGWLVACTLVEDIQVA